MLNLVREGEEDYIEAIRYRRRLKIFENFLFSNNQTLFIGSCVQKICQHWIVQVSPEILSKTFPPV